MSSLRCSLLRKSFKFDSVSDLRQKPSKRFFADIDLDVERVIVDNTVIHRSKMVPELSLRLITPATNLWTATSEADQKLFPSDPFW